MPPKKAGSHGDASQNVSQGYSLADVMSKLTALGSDLTTVKESQGEVMTSIHFLSGKFDEISKQMAEENYCLKSQVTKLQRDVQHLEQYNRGQNLEIAGIPEKPCNYCLFILVTKFQTQTQNDPALAELQLERWENFMYIPLHIQLGVPATLVWDNNDFGEETLSGKGTTHNINGTILQMQNSINATPGKTTSKQRTCKRSLEPPLPDIASYRRGQRKGPEPYRADVQLELEDHIHVQNNARQLDSAYFFTKDLQDVFNNLSGMYLFMVNTF